MQNQTFKVRDFRNKKFFQVDDEYLNGYARICGVTATAVYLVLCRHADRNQEAFPSNALIAEKIGVVRRSVYSALKTLESWNIIEVVKQGRKENGEFRNLTYRLLDKSLWKSKPCATIAHGTVSKLRHSPWANNDTNREQPLLNKDTHIKDTHIRNCKKLDSLKESLKKKRILP